MAEPLRRPPHVKYRREDGYGLVYDHENYGYEDASLYEVSETVVDLLGTVDDEGGRLPREDLERRFSASAVDRLLDRGVLVRAE